MDDDGMDSLWPGIGSGSVTPYALSRLDPPGVHSKTIADQEELSTEELQITQLGKRSSRLDHPKGKTILREEEEKKKKLSLIQLKEKVEKIIRAEKLTALDVKALLEKEEENKPSLILQNIIRAVEKKRAKQQLDLKALRSSVLSCRPACCVVVSQVLCHDNMFERPSGTGLYVDDCLKVCGDDDDAITVSRNVVLKFAGGYLDSALKGYVASCRDLMCFYTPWELFVYSPSTNQYLRYDGHTEFDHHLDRCFFNVTIVYLPSVKLYKIVLLEVVSRRGQAERHHVRYKAITVPEQGREHGSSSSSSWELVSEHDLPSVYLGGMGNFIGVDGVAYVIMCLDDISRPPPPRQGMRGQQKLLSLDLDIDIGSKKSKPFKMLDLPQFDQEEGAKRQQPRSKFISQVKDALCYPQVATSAIHLWLLDSTTTAWFKGYTIHYASPSPLICYVLYSPTGSDHDDDGLFLFQISCKFFRYDTRTRVTVPILKNTTSSKPQLHTFSAGTSFSLKNGSRCHSLPLFIFDDNMPPQAYSLEPPPRSHRLRAQAPLPTPPPQPQSHSRPPPPPQGSLPPPPYSLPPPPFFHNLQHTAPWKMPHPPLPQGIPPPSPFNPYNFQYQNHSLEAVKRRRMLPHSELLTDSAPPPPLPHRSQPLHCFQGFHP